MTAARARVGFAAVGAGAEDERLRDADCVAFLREVLPGLGLRWGGYRRVRRTVRKRLRRRLAALGIADLGAYRARLAHDAGERAWLDAACRISISRFWRDAAVFDALEARVLPERARLARAAGRASLTAWSCGCASGEEPLSLAALWRLRLQPAFAGLGLAILATDADPHLLSRARTGLYPAGALREMPADLRERAFRPAEGGLRVAPELAAAVAYRLEDVRARRPDGPFDLVLCRNLVFTYFAPAVQRELARELAERLHPGGFLVLGRRERLPEGLAGWRRPWPELPLWRREGSATRVQGVPSGDGPLDALGLPAHRPPGCGRAGRHRRSRAEGLP